MERGRVSNRKTLSKRVRFEVFKRDLFTCQYCGATPPGVVLEVDHIDPVAEGGGDEETNLVTACFDCNRGKAAVALTVVPESLADRAARIAEAEEQLAGYRAIMREYEERKDADVWEVIEILFNETSTTHARFGSVKRFLERLPLESVREAANLTRQNAPYYGMDRRFRYFCGICWRWIKESDDGQN